MADKKLDTQNTTANEVYLDAALRHQIGVRRYSAGIAKKVAELLEKADAQLTEQLRVRLGKLEGKPLDFTSERWSLLLSDIRDARKALMTDYRDLTKSELNAFAKLEADRELSLLTTSIPIEVNLAVVAYDQLKAIVSSKPFQGRLLKNWYSNLETMDRDRLVSTLQLGLVNGETTDQIVRRVIGTKRQNYSDGILSITRRDAQSIVRTAINHVSNTARSYVWQANSDIITANIWVSTLDGRTSAICRARDGHGSPVGNNPLPPGVEPLKPEGARPPAHINCRSVMVAYINGAGLIGDRPFVTDTRTRVNREVDFREIAKSEGRTAKQVRDAWAEKNIGRVPASVDYETFLRRQSSAFQDEVLGKTKGRLFRTGKLPLSNFVDIRGNELTLEQLAKTKPEVFKLAGVDLPK